MTIPAQVIFFEKVRALFTRATTGVALHAKKKYRLGPDDVAKVRNLSVLFGQLWPHLKGRLPAVDAKTWEEGFLQTTTFDDDFYTLLETRPSKVSLSMLKSQQEAAKRQEVEKESLIHSEVAAQKEAVQEAQWKYFCSALVQDQTTLKKVHGVPAKVKAKLHEKAVLHRQKQADAGRKATQGYQAGWMLSSFPWM